MYARISIRNLAVAASMILGASSAASAAVLDSSLFNNQYNGNVYPVPNYTENAPFASGPSTDGNNLNFRAPTGGGYFQSSNWSVTGATGFTIEIRAKIDEDFAEGTRGALAVYFSDASAGDTLGISASSLKVGAGSGSFVTVPTASNTDDFHIYRITQAEDGNGPANPTINFYRDGVLVHSWANGGNGPLLNGLLIGSGGSVFGGPTAHVDYIRWDNTGAWEPPVIPEPASLGLVGAAGLLAIRRRR